MLDPRIGYNGLLDDCTHEDGLTEVDLQRSRDALQDYFDKHYKKAPETAGNPSAQPAAQQAATSRMSHSRRCDDVGCDYVTFRVTG